MGNDTLWICGGRVVDPASGRDETADLKIVDGRFADPAGGPATGSRVFDARGFLVVPGLIDLHVHLREPGPNRAETIASGTAAAARGGFTKVLAMPNVEPCPDSVEVCQDLAERARLRARVRVLQCAALTLDRAGRQAADLEGMAQAGVAAFSDDGTTVADESLMEQILVRTAKLGLPVVDHAQMPELEGGPVHAGAMARRHGWTGIPREAETRAVARDVRLVRRTGAALHVQHLSTAGAVELLRDARAQGLPITGEITPHHLALTDRFLALEGAQAKMNPPLREPADRDALRQALCDGAVTVLATDHAPHPAAAKRRSMAAAPFGVVGLETAVGVTYSLLVRRGVLDLHEWLACWTTGPADVIGLPPPSLAPGASADVTVLDVSRPWIVDPRAFASGGRNTPFAGWRLWGRALLTVAAGRVAYQDEHRGGLVSG